MRLRFAYRALTGAPNDMSEQSGQFEFRVPRAPRGREGGAGPFPGWPRQRALLALLLLHANEPVSRERLVDGLWGERPPQTAGNALQVAIHGLRKLLGQERIESRGAGYLYGSRRGSSTPSASRRSSRRRARRRRRPPRRRCGWRSPSGAARRWPSSRKHKGLVPAPPGPLIGRELELAAVTALLAGEHVRLLTLTGAGGTGKTRLALAAAAELHSELEDGVFFVDLAPVADAGLVGSAIAHALGATESGQPSVVDTIKDELAGRKLLLLLDNFEHVTEAASLVGELRAAAPRLKALVTSRSLLRISGEHDYPGSTACPSRAGHEAQEGLALDRGLGDAALMVVPLHNPGLVAFHEHRHDDAAGYFMEMLELGGELEYTENVAYALEGLAAVAAVQGRPERAARLLGAGAAAAEAIGMSPEPLEREIHDRTTTVLLAQLGGTRFAALREQGRMAKTEDVIANELAAWGSTSPGRPG